MVAYLKFILKITNLYVMVTLDLIKDDKESRIKMGEPRRKEDILVDAYYLKKTKAAKLC